MKTFSFEISSKVEAKDKEKAMKKIRALLWKLTDDDINVRELD